jgi:hypothetical protein
MSKSNPIVIFGNEFDPDGLKLAFGSFFSGVMLVTQAHIRRVPKPDLIIEMEEEETMSSRVTPPPKKRPTPAKAAKRPLNAEEAQAAADLAASKRSK